ncbi:MAG: hypothetical protein R2853_18995 [Thermomicrobiales bacterium]
MTAPQRPAQTLPLALGFAPVLALAVAGLLPLLVALLAAAAALPGLGVLRGEDGGQAGDEGDRGQHPQQVAAAAGGSQRSCQAIEVAAVHLSSVSAGERVALGEAGVACTSAYGRPGLRSPRETT